MARMLRQMLLGKLHRVRVTQTDLNYIGSVTIDADLLQAAGILPSEKVLVINLESGARLESYALEGRAGSGVIGMNGGTARSCHIGDRVLICTFGWMEESEAREHRPRVVFVDEANRPARPESLAQRAT